MAGSAVVGILRVLLSANTAEFEAEMKKASTVASKFANDTKSIGQQLQNTGSVLTKAITLPLVGLGAGAAKLAIDFESSFAGVRKTVNATEPEFAAMAQAFRDLAKEIPINVNEINRLGEAAGALGIPKDKIVEFSRVMAELGVTTNVTSDQAAESIAKIQNIFGAAGVDTDRFAATLVHLGNNGASTESQILEMTTRLAGAGHTIGLTEGQVLGFANALASVGLEAEAGGTAMSRVFTKMALAVSQGGEKLDQFAKVAGISSAEFTTRFKTDAAGAVVSFVEGLGRIKTSGGDLIGTLQDMGIKEVRLRDTLLRAAGAGDLMRTSLDLQKTAWEQNTALTNEAGKRFATLESQMTLLWNRVKDVGLDLGNALLPMMKAAVEAAGALVPIIGSLAQWFAGLPQPLQLAAVGLGAVAAAAGPVLIVVGQIAMGTSTLIGLFAKKGIITRALAADYGVLGKSAQSLVGAFGGAAGVGLTGAVLVAMGAMDRLERSTRDANERVKEGKGTWSDVPAVLENAVSRGLNPFGAAWRDLQDGITKAGETWKTVSGWLSTELAPAVTSAKGLLDSLGGAWTAFGQLVGALVDVALAKVKELASGIVDWLGTKLKPVFEFFGPAFTAVQGVFAAAKDSIVGSARLTYEGVRDWLVTKFTAIVDSIKAKVDLVTGYFKTMYDKVVGHSYVPDLVREVIKQFGLLQTGMVTSTQVATDQTAGRFQWLKDQGVGIFNGLVASVKSNFEQMLTGAESFKAGFLNIWRDLKSRVSQLLTDLLHDFQDRFLKGLVSAATGQGGFASAFSGLLGLGGGSGVPTLGIDSQLPGATAGAGLSSVAGGGIAAGAGIGLGQLGQHIFGGAGAGAATFGGLTGAAQGALMGSIVPGIGTVIGALIGGLSGVFGGLFGKSANAKANDTRDAFLGQFGGQGTGEGSGFGNLAARLTEATGEAGGGSLFKAFLDAHKAEDVTKAIQNINAALAAYEAKTKSAADAEAAQAAQIDATKAALEEKTKAIHDQMAGLDDELKKLNASEAPEEHMGTVERKARERIAREKEDLQRQLDAAQKAAADAIEAIKAAGTGANDALKTQGQTTIDLLKGGFLDLQGYSRDQIDKIREALLNLGKNIPPINIPVNVQMPEGPDGSPTIPMPSVPGHAAGGVFSSPHLARIAEGGQAEIVGSVGFMSRALAGALAMNGGASGPIQSVTIMELDKREIGRAIANVLPGELRRLGIRVRT
jgi:TP901 family phage tail tape measure protein